MVDTSGRPAVDSAAGGRAVLVGSFSNLTVVPWDVELLDRRAFNVVDVDLGAAGSAVGAVEDIYPRFLVDHPVLDRLNDLGRLA
jgi:hypothetical protein